MQCCFFEDDLVSRFYPLTLTRPMDDIRIGIGTLSEKWKSALGEQPGDTIRILRTNLQGVFEQGPVEPDVPCAWINSRFLPTRALVSRVRELEIGSCLTGSNQVIAAKTEAATAETWLSNGRADFSNLLVLETETDSFTQLQHLWDLFQLNGQETRADIERFGITDGNNASISDKAILSGREDIHVGDNAMIEPGAILMADTGPIYIGPGATVGAGAILKGPVAICRNSIVKPGARIYDATTIGPVCKAGGEIGNTIFHSYSNKGHEGYLGNSLIGQWCNFGADTNTSNLKNNYSTIRLTDWETMQQVETGQQFIGTIMGDHSKTAINVQLNTGTICGVSCNIFTSDFPPKLIPSFTWVGTNVMQPYKFDKAVETMEAVMKRRDVAISDDYIRMMKTISADSRN
ncbi:MAG: putative sugar nucleotidyl transferase [Balneolaceae bacterium]|nr:putative sugar nucleotidyl transferase [Balneolaceae bacterium]